VPPAPPGLSNALPPADAAPHDDIVELLRQVTGEDREWSAGVGAATRLDGDLFLDSIELAALSGLLVHRYGPPGDLAAYVAGLDLDQLIALTVGDVADLVIRARS